MQKKLKLLQDAYPKKQIESMEVFLIDGELLGTKKTVARIMNVTERSIVGWEKRGFGASKYSVQGMPLYDINKLRDWHLENIDQKKSRNSGDVNVPVITNDENVDNIDTTDITTKIKQATDLINAKTTSIETADRVGSILNALTRAVKLSKEAGDLIPKRDTEKVIIEIIAVVISGYKKDIRMLPRECEDRSEAQIKEILETNYKTNIEKLKKLAKSEMVSNRKLYDVMEGVYELLLSGVSPDELLNMIGYDKWVH